MPSISILVPIFKVPEKCLRRCIESLLNQTLKNIEIILVDDGSPDENGKIIDEYAATDERIIAVHQKNKGLSGARNTAFDNASGEYVMFLDGDDYLENNTCERAFSIAHEYNVDIVIWDIITDYGKGNKLTKTIEGNSRLLDTQDCNDMAMRVLNFNGHVGQVFGKIIRNSLLRDNNIRHIDSLKQGAEGIVFNVLLYDKVNSIYYLNEALNHYVYNDQSISHSHNDENYKLIIQCFEYIRDYYSGNKQKDKIEEAIYTRVLYVIITTAISGYFNPDSGITYKERVIGMKKFLDDPMIQTSLRKGNKKSLDRQRKIIIFFIKNNWWLAIQILAKIRRKQYAMR